LTITVCGLLSRFASVTATVNPEGAEIVGGESAPAAKILNVAGTRAPLGAGGEVRAEPGTGFGVVVAVAVVLVGAGVVALVEAVVVALVEAVVGACEAVRSVVDGVLPEPPHPASRRTERTARTFIPRLTLAA
jgi:hypothetical protein